MAVVGGSLVLWGAPINSHRSIQQQNGQMAVSTGDSSVQCQVSSASDAVTDDADCG
jgi:hypothetical protein